MFKLGWMRHADLRSGYFAKFKDDPTLSIGAVLFDRVLFDSVHSMQDQAVQHGVDRAVQTRHNCKPSWHKLWLNVVPQKHRLENQPVFILHSYPYRETSLIVEVFSQNFGRLPLVARGARRPRSAVRGLLMAFQPLHLSWFGKAELRTLHSAEWQGGQPQLQGMALMCGFYLNELLLKLLHARRPPRELCSFITRRRCSC